MKKAQVVDLIGRILLVILLALALLALDVAFAQAAPTRVEKAAPVGVASWADGGAVSGYAVPANPTYDTRRGSAGVANTTRAVEVVGRVSAA